jgi:predicted nucleotidyltransferase
MFSFWWSRRYWSGSKEGCMASSVFTDHLKLAELCRRHHIVRLALFGSTLEGTAGPDSDVDLLVEFQPGMQPGLLRLASIEAELSGLAGGYRIDLRTVQDLSHHFRDDVR